MQSKLQQKILELCLYNDMNIWNTTELPYT